MPYKDPERQRAAQHQSYLRNKATIMERQRQRRRAAPYRRSARERANRDYLAGFKP